MIDAIKYHNKSRINNHILELTSIIESIKKMEFMHEASFQISNAISFAEQTRSSLTGALARVTVEGIDK